MSFKAIKYDFGNEVHLAWYAMSFDKLLCAQEVLPTLMPSDGVMNPFLKLTQQDAQSLIDALYEAGMRPSSDCEPKKGELSAVRYHLEDMRRLVFNGKKAVD